MKQLVILSGKGGTGKTSLAAAFAHLAHDGSHPVPAVLADADVDAANLELVLRPERLETHDFTGGSLAVIDPQRCNSCGNCEQVCRFDAVYPPVLQGKGSSDAAYHIDPIACEGCAACVYQCPEDAIRMEPQVVGQWYRSQSRFGPLFHANLKPAQENSGKLVTLVKQQARLLAMDSGAAVLIVDGPPGIGCPVISAASGADLALIVVEPTIAGAYDMKRILKTTEHFHLPALVCINKADLFQLGSKQIEAYCWDNEFEIVGKIPFDEAVTQAMITGEPVTAYQPAAPASQAMAAIWERIVADIALS